MTGSKNCKPPFSVSSKPKLTIIRLADSENLDQVVQLVSNILLSRILIGLQQTQTEDNAHEYEFIAFIPMVECYKLLGKAFRDETYEADADEAGDQLCPPDASVLPILKKVGVRFKLPTAQVKSRI